MANMLPAGPAANAPQLSLADFMMRKLNEIGPMSKDDLVSPHSERWLARHAESAARSVQAALLSILRNEHIRRLQNGTFAPATLSQTIRLRRSL